MDPYSHTIYQQLKSNPLTGTTSPGPAGRLKSQPLSMRGSRLSTAADASSTKSPQKPNCMLNPTCYSGAATVLNN